MQTWTLCKLILLESSHHLGYYQAVFRVKPPICKGVELNYALTEVFHTLIDGAKVWIQNGSLRNLEFKARSGAPSSAGRLSSQRLSTQTPICKV